MPGERSELVDLAETVAANIVRLRTDRKLSLSQLAKTANVGKATLSQLEAGSANPSIETLTRVSVALGVPFAELIVRPSRVVTVRRRHDSVELGSENGRFRGHLVHRELVDGSVECYQFRVAPGTAYLAEPHPAGTRETVLCVTGALEVGPLGAEVTLGEGDSVSFAADLSHSYRASETPADIVLLLRYPWGTDPGTAGELLQPPPVT